MIDVNWQALINTIISVLSGSQGCPQTVRLLGAVLKTKANHASSDEQALCYFIWYLPRWFMGWNHTSVALGASFSFLNSESHLFRQSRKSVEKSLSSQILKEKIESGKMEKWCVLLPARFLFPSTQQNFPY